MFGLPQIRAAFLTVIKNKAEFDEINIEMRGEIGRISIIRKMKDHSIMDLQWAMTSTLKLINTIKRIIICLPSIGKKTKIYSHKHFRL